MNYLNWDEKTITDFSHEAVSKMYKNGYVFTRIGKGVMDQTRSVRVDLAKFELTSENRRILKKVGDKLKAAVTDLPVKVYDIKIGKLAKDFYTEKFGEGVMSAQKVKEMLTDPARSNFNLLLNYDAHGFAICYANNEILHYSYPFYDLKESPKDMGLAMMIKSIQYAKDAGKKYVYLGSLQRPGDTYKLQFTGLEWFDGKEWRNDLEEVKKTLKSDDKSS